MANLEGRSFEVAQVAGGWMLRTRPAYAAAIRAAADVGEQDLNLREFDVAVLAAYAYHQPVTRDGLKDKLDNAAFEAIRHIVENTPDGPWKFFLLLLGWVGVKIISLILLALLIVSRPTLLL